jgi:hypothetical protein
MVMWADIILYEIWGFHGSDDIDVVFLGFDAVLCGLAGRSFYQPVHTVPKPRRSSMMYYYFA